MHFKNAMLYRLTAADWLAATFDSHPVPIAALEKALAEFAFVPPTAQEAIKTGFFPPLPAGKALCYRFDHYLMFTLKQQWKDIPASALNDEMEPRILTAVAEKGGPLSKKEKQEIKEQALQCLLPRAFCKSALVRCYIDLNSGLVVVDTSSSAKSELLLAMLRKALGSLPVLPWFDNHQLHLYMQLWLQNKNLPEGITRGHRADLKAPDEEGAQAKFNNHVIDENVLSHLEDKLVKKLGLGSEHLDFAISDNGVISGLKFSTEFLSKNDEMGWDDHYARLDADYVLMAGEIGRLVKALTACVAKPLEAAENTSKAETAPDEALDYSEYYEDPLYSEARQYVIATGRATVSAVQRKFRIGYNRAARIVEILELRGVVSCPGHNGQREVLVTE